MSELPPIDSDRFAELLSAASTPGGWESAEGQPEEVKPLNALVRAMEMGGVAAIGDVQIATATSVENVWTGPAY